jgi:hypothetical protein
MAAFWAIITGYLAVLIGFAIRFIQDDKDGVRDGFDDSKEVK